MQRASGRDTDELFQMANLFPCTTGLPVIAWVSPRGNARHDVRVKVNMTHGNQMTVSNTAVLGVRPTPHLIAGQSSAEDQRAVSEWVSLNTDAFVAHWEGRIDTVQLGQALKQLPSAQPGSASAP
jgi:hypothetical protein